MEKHVELAARLAAIISDALRNPESENYLGADALDDGNAFFHALGNMMPCLIYSKLAESVDIIGFNHVMNRLCFQYSQLDAKQDDQATTD